MKRIMLILLIISISTNILCACSDKKIPDETQIKAICELSTLECYYNNVAKSTKEKGTGFTHTFEKEREFWIEYEGVAQIGIDMSLVTMEINDMNVTINIPSAKILNVGIVTDTLNEESYIISKDGFLNKNKITAEEQQMAIANAQAEMQKTVTENKALFERAEKKAKDLIENYINKLGEISGKRYNIIWNKI